VRGTHPTLATLAFSRIESECNGVARGGNLQQYLDYLEAENLVVVDSNQNYQLV